MIIFEKIYDGESLVDIEEDVYDAVNASKFPIPYNEEGFHAGTFTVTISWKE